MGGIVMGRETDAKPSRTACIRTHVLHVHTGCGFVGRAAWVYFVDVVPQRSLGPCEVSLVLVLAVVAGISFVDIDVGDDAQKPGSRGLLKFWRIEAAPFDHLSKDVLPSIWFKNLVGKAFRVEMHFEVA